MQVKKQQFELDMEQQTGSKLGKEYIKTIYYHLAYLTYMHSESESHSVVSNSLRPHGLYSPWNSPGQNTGIGSLSLLQGIFQPRDRTPTLQAGTTREAQEYWSGYLFLLQWIFPTQESN